MRLNDLFLLPETLLASAEKHWQNDHIIAANIRKGPDVRKKYCYSPYHLFIYVHNGMQMIHRNGNSFMVGEEEACFIKYGDFFLSEMPTVVRDFQSTTLFMSDEFIKRLLRISPLQSDQSSINSDLLKVSKNDLLAADIQSLRQQLVSKQQADLEKRIVSILKNLLKSNFGNELNVFLPKLLEPIETELQKLFSDKQRLLLSLAALAQISGRSLAEFERDITQNYAVSPQQWLNEKRLEHAYFKLVHTPDSIETVSRETGFNNPAEFSMLFKQKFGQSPEDVSGVASR